MNKFKYLLYLLITLVSVILIIYAVNIFPIPGTDSRVFIPPALFYSKGLGLINPLYNITFLKGLYASRLLYFQFNYYVPFFPMIIGLLSKISPSVKTLFFICSLFSISALFLYGKVVFSIIGQKANLLLKIMILISVTYISTYLLPTVGRPENLSSLLVLLIYIVYNKRAKIGNMKINIYLCALFSILISTQIICFFFCTLFFLTYEILNTENIYRTIWINALRFTVIGIISLIILCLSPNGLLNTINGIKVHGTWALTRADRSITLFIYYWIFAPLNFAFLVIFILCTVFYVRSLYTRCKNLKFLQIFIICVLQLMIVYGIPKFIFYASPTVYNATQFIFPLSIYLLFNFTLIKKEILKRTVAFFITLTYIGGNILFLRWILLFIDYKTNGRDFNNAYSVANKIVRENTNSNIYITSALWPLFDTKDMNTRHVMIANGPLKKGDVFFIQQIYNRNIDAYLKRGTIIYDWRVEEKMKLFGVPLSFSPQCYSFVVCKIN